MCRWLELGLVVDWKGFPGFGEAFDTGEIAWDIDSSPFRHRAVEIYEGRARARVERSRERTGIVRLP